MPKGKRKDKRRRREEELASDDSMSVASMSSETSNGANFDDGVDESSAVEIFEDKLKDAIDGLTEKSTATRVDSLKSLEAALKKCYNSEFYLERKLTVVEGLLKCVRRGAHNEQVLAAKCMCLLSLQLGASTDNEEVLKEVRPYLETAIVDPSMAPEARAACAGALGICCFIAEEEMQNLGAVMAHFQTQFSGSFLKGDSTPPALTPGKASLHTAALSAWSLLLTIAPPQYVTTALTSTLPNLPGLLESKDLDLRCMAGESIALLYEIARSMDEDFEGPDEDQLYSSLKQLATDGAKSRAKRDRRQQRANFRDILQSLEDGRPPQVQVKVTHQGGGVEQLNLGTWRCKVQYDAICQMLGSGMSQHLSENELLRDIFRMGPPPVRLSQHERQENKLTEKYENAAAFKERTKMRAKVRDKRFVTANGE